MFIGGSLIVAYSVADGTVLWTTSPAGGSGPHNRGSGVIGLSGDGTRVFGAGSRGRGITTAAYWT